METIGFEGTSVNLIGFLVPKRNNRFCGPNFIRKL